jgi:anti-sigma B factor antagonist
MRFLLRESGDVRIVDLEGHLVAGVGDGVLHGLFDQLLGDGTEKILLNLSGVEKIDSSGVGELVAGHRLAQKMGSSVKLVRVGERVDRVLRLSHILPLLEIYESEEEALEGFSSDKA